MMTQEELAAAVGVSRQTIAAVEKGTYNPSVVLALRCAEVFQVSVEDLFMIRGSADIDQPAWHHGKK